MNSNIEVGRWGENLSAYILQNSGYTLLELNWRAQPHGEIKAVPGEIDLVMLDPSGRCVVFVEVKTRSSSGFGSPLEAITSQKSLKLRSLAYAWMSENKSSSSNQSAFQIDAIAITGTSDQFTFEHLRAVA